MTNKGPSRVTTRETISFDPFHDFTENSEEKKTSEDFEQFLPAGTGELFTTTDVTWGDPWSTDQWKPQNDAWSIKPGLVETSIDSAASSNVESSVDSSSLQLSGSSPKRLGVPLDQHKTSKSANGLEDSKKPHNPLFHGSMGSSEVFVDDSDAFIRLSPPRDPQHRIHVIHEERLSILFDGVTSEPSCRVIGSIYVKPSKSDLNSFCFTLRDKKGHIEKWEEQLDVCKNITAAVPHLALDHTDQVFRVSLKSEKLEEPVVEYSCVPALKPIPLLLKTKVQRKEHFCRVGIRIRANPSNGYTLTRVAILMVNPPDINGSKASMSREGGIWDEMKRTITWTVETMAPGETIDIQAQFEYAEGLDSSATSKFPVLVQCDGGSLFSKIELSTDFTDEDSTPANVRLEHSSRILYRMV